MGEGTEAATWPAFVETIPPIAYVRQADHVGTFSYVSPQARALLGRGAGAFPLDRRRWLALVHPDDRPRVIREEARAAATGEPFHVEYRVRGCHGRDVWLRDEAAPVCDPDGNVRSWHGVLVDVSAQKAHQSALAHRALHDPLTGLPNRALFVGHLDQALARARRAGTAVAVLVLDLDDLKAVNDRFGYAAGDRVLVGVGERLRAVVAPGDTVARLAEDEFGAVVGGAHDAPGAERAAERAAERVATALWPPFGFPGGETRVTVSVGVAVGVAGGDAEALLARAESELRRVQRPRDARFGFFDGDRSPDEGDGTRPESSPAGWWDPADTPGLGFF